jgi:hypothetical protein
MVFINFKKAYNSVRNVLLYSMVTELRIPKKLVRVVRMCFNKSWNRICTGERLSNGFYTQNGQEQGDALSPVLFNVVQDSQTGR